jgi:hypothetical protein
MDNDNELESKWKEEVIVQLEKLSRNLAGEAKKHHENIRQDSRYETP